MTAQEKLNEIDALLYKAGFTEPDTIKKVEMVIQNHKEMKNGYEYKSRQIEQVIHFLEYGYIDD
jgi:hypothetical protein